MLIFGGKYAKAVMTSSDVLFVAKTSVQLLLLFHLVLGGVEKLVARRSALAGNSISLNMRLAAEEKERIVK